MESIQDIFNNAGSNLTLVPNEYEGPLIIDRSCVIDGKTSTLWVNDGPALIIRSNNVTIRNLRIDVIGNSGNYDHQTAIQGNNYNVIFENVEVTGRVAGVYGESADWQLPKTLSLGDIKAEQENYITIALDAAADADIINNIKCIELSASKLNAGRNVIKIKTDKILRNTILYGELLIKTNITRTIYLIGHVKENPVITGSAIIAEPYFNTQITYENKTFSNVSEYIADGYSSEYDSFKDALKGQRTALDNDSVIDIEYTQKSSLKAEVDGYAFLLKDDEKVNCESDFIFFANKKSPDNSVIISDSCNKTFHIELNKISSYIEKIVICYSIYEDDGHDFTNIDPEILVYLNSNPFFKMKINNLNFIKTVVALEIYKNKGKWKINFVGSGYRDKLAKLCDLYGIEVK